MIEKELRRIDEIGLEAWEYVCEGEFRKARRVLRQIENSFCCTESSQVICIIYAEIAHRKGNYDEAATLIKANIGSLWGIPDGLEILNRRNPPADEDTRLFRIKISGGRIVVGMPDDYATVFEIIARSELEAWQWLDALELYERPERRRIHECVVSDFDRKLYRRCGVVKTNPFELVCDDRSGKVENC